MALKYFDVTGSDPLSSGDDVCLSSNVGKVGIGTTSPAQKLHVEGNVFVKSGEVVFLGSTSHYIGDTDSGTGIRIVTSGNVGIGTTSPGAKLDTKGDNATAGNTALALRVQDGDSVEMFAVKDALDSSSKNVTVLSSVGGQLVVTPKAITRDAVQAAIDFLENNGDKGGKILLPAGVFDIPSSLNIGKYDGTTSGALTAGSGIQLIGAGTQLTILKITNDSGIAAISINGGQDSSDHAFNSQNVVIKDLQITIESGSDHRDKHTGILNRHGCDVLIENVRIQGIYDTDDRMKIGIKSTSWGNTYHSCQVAWFSESGILLTADSTIVRDGSTGISANCEKIVNCAVTLWGRGTPASEVYGIKIQGVTNLPNLGNVITGCTIQPNNKYNDKVIGILVGDISKQTVITGDYFEKGDIGVKIQSTGNTVIGNLFTQVDHLISIDSGKEAGNIIMGSKDSDTGLTDPSAFNTAVEIENSSAGTKSLCIDHSGTSSLGIEVDSGTGAGGGVSLIANGITATNFALLVYNSSNKMTVDYNGNGFFDGSVGIGTASPAQKLEVNGNIKLSGSLPQEVLFGSQGAIKYESSDTMVILNKDSSGVMRFKCTQSTEGDTELVTLRPTYSAVGINNTSPTETLDVNGNIKASGGLIISGSTAPSSPSAGMLWYDTTGGVNQLKIRNIANTGWNMVFQNT